MKVRSVAVGLLLAISASSCRGDGGDPYVNLRDSPLLSDLPPDAIALDVECRKVEQIAATDYFTCTRSYATDLEIPDIRAFHLPRIEALGYEVSIDGPQGQTANRYLISAIRDADYGVTMRVADPFVTPPEFAERRWTVVIEVAEQD